MIIRAEDSKIVMNSDGVLGKSMGELVGCEFVNLELKPGAEIPAHQMEMPVSFIILSGEGMIIVDDQEDRVGEGDLVSVDKGSFRGWSNPSAGDLRILVVKHIRQGMS